MPPSSSDAAAVPAVPGTTRYLLIGMHFAFASFADESRQPAKTKKMLITKPHIVTHGVDGEAMTLVFYPDTGCLRFADARGVCHELRPPHSWLALASTSRGVRAGTQAVTDGLNRLLHDFCMKRSHALMSRSYPT